VLRDMVQWICEEGRGGKRKGRCQPSRPAPRRRRLGLEDLSHALSHRAASEGRHGGGHGRGPAGERSLHGENRLGHSKPVAHALRSFGVARLLGSERQLGEQGPADMRKVGSREDAGGKPPQRIAPPHVSSLMLDHRGELRGGQRTHQCIRELDASPPQTHGERERDLRFDDGHVGSDVLAARPQTGEPTPCPRKAHRLGNDRGGEERRTDDEQTHAPWCQRCARMGETKMRMIAVPRAVVLGEPQRCRKARREAESNKKHRKGPGGDGHEPSDPRTQGWVTMRHAAPHGRPRGSQGERDRRGEYEPSEKA